MDDDGRSLLFFFILSKDSHHISCRHKERINIFKSIEFSLIDSINDGTEMIKDEKIKKRSWIQNPEKKFPTFLVHIERCFHFHEKYGQDLLVIRSELNRFVSEFWREIGQVSIRFQPRFVWWCNLFLLKLWTRTKKKYIKHTWRKTIFTCSKKNVDGKRQEWVRPGKEYRGFQNNIACL